MLSSLFSSIIVSWVKEYQVTKLTNMVVIVINISFNLYGFEVWNNEENAKLLETISNKLDIKIGGVPFTIIGDKYYSGFGENTKKKIEKTIKNEYKTAHDIMNEK